MLRLKMSVKVKVQVSLSNVKMLKSLINKCWRV
jgi:hypothetical protein